jgi:hypothetical protein
MTAIHGKGRLALVVLPLVIVPAAFIVIAPWLKTAIGSTMTMLVAAATAIAVMAYSLYLSIRSQRCLDEVQAEGGRFAARWGLSIGPVIFASLLLLPPFLDMATAVIGDAAGATADRKVVTFAIMFGFGGVVILQTLAMVVINRLWWRARR